jgi:hypothetical protein
MPDCTMCGVHVTWRGLVHAQMRSCVGACAGCRCEVFRVRVRVQVSVHLLAFKCESIAVRDTCKHAQIALRVEISHCRKFRPECICSHTL